MQTNRRNCLFGRAARLGVILGLLVIFGTRNEAFAQTPPLDTAAAHKARGEVLYAAGKFTEAEAEFQSALRLDPNGVHTLLQLASTYQRENRRPAALEAYNQALLKQPFGPYTGFIYASMADLDAEDGNEDKARAELSAGKAWFVSGDASTEQLLWTTYDRLRERPAAVEHCRKFLALARSPGVNPETVTSADKYLRAYEAKLIPFYLANAPPRDYTESELNQVLHDRLPPDELPLVVHPLADNAEMRAWARELTSRTTNDLEKARILCDELSDHPRPATDPQCYTAREVFARWKTKTSFWCTDYACLYVALARAAGLKAYFVEVAQLEDGLSCDHACAAVFINGKGLLVDPTRDWVGVPHKKFTVLDDLQTEALWLTLMTDLKRCRIACKLTPDFLAAHTGLFFRLAYEYRWDEARSELGELARLDPNGWSYYYAQGTVAFGAGRSESAVKLIREAITLAPELSAPYIKLSQALAAQGDWPAARVACQDALKYSFTRLDTNTCQQQFLYLEQATNSYFMRAAACSSARDWPGALTNFDLAIQLDPGLADTYFRRGYVRWQNHDLDGARMDYDKAIELKPDFAEAFCGRGGLKQIKRDFDGARVDYDRAIEFKPDSAEAYQRRGVVKRITHDLDGALLDFDRAIELQPDYAEAYGNRGAVKQIKRDLDGALLDYDRAIELKPDYADAYCNRADVKSSRDDLDGAFADYTKSFLLKPDLGPTHFPRVLKLGELHYRRREFDKAATVLRKVCDIGAGDDYAENDYLHTRLWLTRARAGDRAAATRELADYLDTAKTPNSTNWSLGMVQFLADQLTEEDFLKAAASPDAAINAQKYSQAYYIAGSKRLISGDTAAAIDFFEKCVAMEDKSSMPYADAVAELHFLREKTATPNP